MKRLFILLSLSFVLVTPIFSTAQDIPVGPIAYWSFDNCDARDDSGAGHAGTIFGNPSCVSGGTPSGSALEFDANKWVKVNSTPDLKFEPGSSFTLSVFVKPQTRDMVLCDETGNWCTDEWAAIVNKGPTSGFWDYGICYNRKTRTFIAGYHENITVSSGVGSVTEDQWYHVLVTYQNGSWNFYVNGVLVSTNSGKYIRMSDGSLAIGRKGDSTNYATFFQGLIDEVLVYNRVLSEQEILELYNTLNPASSSDWIVNPANGHLYKFLEECGHWHDCENLAVAEGAHLVTIRNAAEQAWLANTFPTGGNPWFAWIGMTDEEQEGTWVWVSGEPVTYTNWAPGEPNNYWECGEDYAHTGTNWTWNDLGLCGPDWDRVTNAIIEKVPSQPPLADAGTDQTVHIGSVATLDGTGSSDPDNNYPLTYQWSITSKPLGSTAILSDPTSVSPSFDADMFGDFIIELMVTDSLGLSSAVDSVKVSTYNTPPVADAGLDQFVTLIGSTVSLDGTTSYDEDGDDFTYSWTLIQKPPESEAALSDPTSGTPTFIADVHGDYVASLVVMDEFGAMSEADSVIISFTNVKPVANAGGNHSVFAGDAVLLNGTGSTDANGDPLTYSWNLVCKPSGSTAILSNATNSTASLVTDLPGEYVISLVVNDGFIDSDPDNVTVTATSRHDQVILTLQEATQTINLLPPSVLKNSNMTNALTNKINAALGMIDQGLYQDALDKLENDILQKTDGCATAGTPDRNDWLTECGEQMEVYPTIMEAIEILRNMI